MNKIKEKELTEEVEQEKVLKTEKLAEEEIIDEQEILEEIIEETDYITQTKPLGRLVILVAITAIMLISSTYAWFSAQKNVSLSGIEGTVNVAEGLMVSLDAKNWSQAIDLKNPLLDSGKTLDVPYSALSDGTSYGAGSNNRPSELLPVSATGVEDIKTETFAGNSEMSFYVGTNINGTELYEINKTKAHISESTGTADIKYPGFYAIDIYLQNSSKVAESDQGTATETLQLNTNSLLSLLSSGSAETTGLQNTARVALAMYDTEGLTNNGNTVGTDASSIYITANQSQILTAYEGQKISDIAIWEPNASTHVENIVTNNNTLKLTTAVDGIYTATTADASNNNISKFTGTEVVPTYAMTAESLNASQQLKDYNATTGADKVGIKDIYNWNITDTNSDGIDDETGLSRQITLQTDTESDYTIGEGGVRNLVSVKSPGTAVYEMGDESGVVTFEMLKNSIIKLRMYVWLEGQDVDCTNFASHGGGVRVDLGLVKSAVVGSAGDPVVGGNTTSLGTYLPTGFTEVAEATETTGLTIEDSTGNEYVWVEVPKSSTTYPTAGLNITEFTSDEYTAIENDLHTYTSTYRNGTSYSDVHSGNDASTGLTSTQYTELKQKMLKSVYQNGGFYVGKYEAGTATVRTSSGATLTTVVSQADAYPYNYVTNSQAQTLASGMESGEYTSSLMFGVQWDLVLKYFETKGVASQADLTTDSTSWGNYYNNVWSVTSSSAKYSTNYGETYRDTPYAKTANADVLLTTGADSSFSKMGIYDIAGNVYEWTLEYTSNSSYPCAYRGGSYSDGGGSSPASCRVCGSTTDSGYSVGFRPSLY